jgi:FkbM family methyltransferase
MARSMSSQPIGVVREATRHGKVRIGQALSSPALGTLIAHACRDRIRSKGIVIDTSAPEFTAVAKAQLAFGIYENAEISFIRRYLRGYLKVLELGASLGVTAAHIIDVAAPGAEVICVEANPHLLATLRATTTASAARTGSRVAVIHGAVPPDPANPSRSVVLTLGRSHLGSRAGPVSDGDPGRRLEVPAVDLAEVIRDWSGYGLVCDIEGAEAALILSRHSVLTRASRLVIELHETTYRQAAVTVADLKNALLTMGFSPIAENGRVIVLDGPVAADVETESE